MKVFKTKNVVFPLNPNVIMQNEHCNFFILQKGTKNALEMGRTFCTILADMDFKQRLLEAHSEEEFKTLVLNQTKDLAAENKTTLKPLTYSTTDVQNVSLFLFTTKP